MEEVKPPPPTYVPAPSSPRRRLPWWAIGLIGCAGVCLLLTIGVVVAGYMGVRQFQGAAANITEPQIRAELQPIPIYPAATLERNMTSGLAVVKMIPGAKQAMKGGGAFLTPASPQKVIAYYRHELKALGYTEQASANRASGAEQLQYLKGNDAVLIQTQPAKGQTAIIIQRMDAAALRGRSGN
jgi:hypothetical protein